jgi:hypothetical protein
LNRRTAFTDDEPDDRTDGADDQRTRHACPSLFHPTFPDAVSS